MVYRSGFEIGVLEGLPGVAREPDLACRASFSGTLGFTTTMRSRGFARGRSCHR